MLITMLKKQKRNIIYIDEIDKVARKSENPKLQEMFQEKVFNKLYLKY